MALTQTLVGVTADRVTFLITHDGAAGDTLVLSATILGLAAVANQVGADNFLSSFFRKQWDANNQANARRRLLGSSVLANLLNDVAHCRTFVRPETGLIDNIVVDADVDGVDPLQNELNITTSGGVAGSFLLDVEYQHTKTR